MFASTSVHNAPIGDNLAVKPDQHQPHRRRALVDISNRNAVSQKHTNNVGKPVKATKIHQRQQQTDDMHIDAYMGENLLDDDVGEEDEIDDVDQIEGSEPMMTRTPCVKRSTILVSSIDVDDLNDPQAVAEYVEDIFNFYFRVESKDLPCATYMDAQKDIRKDMRRVLIDWLIEVHTMFKLKPETLFLAMNILDRFLAVNLTVERSRLQLVGSTALLVASKYEEMYAPEVEDFVYVADKAFNRDDVLKCESVICTQLGFQFSYPTPFHFAQRFAKVAKLSERNAYFMFYLMELALLEYGFLRYSPSVIAASAVYLTTYFDATPWSDLLVQHTRYTYANIRLCVKDIYAILATAKTSSVRKKYSSKKRLHVTQIGDEVVASQVRQQEEQNAATQ